jgi:1,4-alpha-glucan branching enzyme
MEAGEMAKKKETDASVAIKKSVTKKVPFEFLAPDAQEVCLAGDFNNWDASANPMKRDKKGLWKASLTLVPGRYEYRFLADGLWENDPDCRDCVPNEFGSMNCVRIVE